ncbi:MAG: hypothetical protein HYS13_16075 [Planctomycetia bacterium]|nr:hypothetical protein [Planctomycetia bacterium]
MHAWLLAVALTSACPHCPPHGPINRVHARAEYEYQYRLGCGSADRHCWSCQHGASPRYDFRRELDYPWFAPSRPQLLELYPPPPAEMEDVPRLPEPPATAPPQTTRRQAGSTPRSRGAANPLRHGPTSE